MIGFLFSILVFCFVAVIATRICTAKNWPLSVGLAVGIGGQILGRIVFSIVASILVLNESPFGLIVIVVPLLGMLLPLIIASMLPQHRDRRQDWIDSHPCCARCGSPTAVSTPVCEKCVG